uniref:Uncharacterized protein n=1 Tax=Marseillevirus LCMAC101 TaxID=2506602 RepID=A0A481YSK2_9VIRU|nr:MAG: hypothetical protein LCMAC101_06340 [Marseillevirus LCMAC101]
MAYSNPRDFRYGERQVKPGKKGEKGRSSGFKVAESPLDCVDYFLLESYKSISDKLQTIFGNDLDDNTENLISVFAKKEGRAHITLNRAKSGAEVDMYREMMKEVPFVELNHFGYSDTQKGFVVLYNPYEQNIEGTFFHITGRVPPLYKNHDAGKFVSETKFYSGHDLVSIILPISLELKVEFVAKQ